MIHRRARRVSSVCGAVAGLFLAACGAKDSVGPSTTDGTLIPGQGAVLSATTPLTLEGGTSGTENLLVVVGTDLTSGSAKFSYSVTATGTGAAGAVSAPASALLPSAAGPALSRTGLSEPMLDMGFGMRLNERSQSRFRTGFRAARSAFASRTGLPKGMSRSLGVAVPQVGDIFTINVGTSEPCTQIANRSGQVVAIGTQSIVLSDTQNPSGGFTTADYQRFAARFDTLVYPLAVENFGAPADIDQNNKILLFFTTAVNALTPAKSESYVAGFFYNRDLFPLTDTPELPGCAGSNYGELFYLLAPDPNGVINGNVRRTGFVDSVTTSVIAHEFEHLINASRRIYVTQGVSDFEVGWLDEGLAHIAEELLFLREAGLTPRRNLDSIAVRSSERIRNAFNMDMGSNASRYRSFLAAPSENSPFNTDDSLETRGATWNLLRYLADRKAGGATSDAATWQALVNTARVGVPNLSAVFGSDLAARVRDWNVSHYMDDQVNGLPAEFSQPSWHWHSLYKALGGSGPAYPLEVKTLTGGSATGTVLGGSAAYYRFSIPPNTTATITLSTPSPIDARVVRIR